MGGTHHPTRPHHHAEVKGREALCRATPLVCSGTHTFDRSVDSMDLMQRGRLL